MNDQPLYDNIGQRYIAYRQADPRLTHAILDLLKLSQASVIAEVGAGTGNYSLALAQKGHYVTAVEPSSVMRHQRKQHEHVEWINASAENIPLASSSVDASIGILSFHHFSDDKMGLEEMARISKNSVVLLFTFDPRQIERPWLTNYFPFLWDDAFKYFPPVQQVADLVRTVTGKKTSIHTFELPHDLKDLFLAAGWRRPDIYLDPGVRSSMSGFAIADKNLVDSGVNALRKDIKSGVWEENYGWLREKHRIDFGYRFILSATVSHANLV